MDGAGLSPILPPAFADWFAARGWAPRRHQLAMVEKARAGRHALLIAPTGGGKTLAGFLPSLIELSERPPANAPRGVHTLYISPLKALAVDIERNLAAPAPRMTVESPASGIESRADRDENVVMRLELSRAAADGNGLAGEGQLDAEMSDLPRPLRAMTALDDHPARGQPVEDAL